MQVGGTERFGVLVASGGAAWEGAVVEKLAAAGPGVVLLRRCLDVTELLAAATTGTARVAVVSPHLSGLDADAVAQLGRHGTGVLAISGGREPEHARLRRVGVATVLPAVDESFVAALRELAVASDRPRPDHVEELPAAVQEQSCPGKAVAVWGPHGAPGRTTVAVGVAAALAKRGVSTFLLDTDPYGGAVAQHLGITDEVSGLLAAARAANAGLLDARRLAGFARQVDPRLRVLTGLPRPDRWREIRPTGAEELVARAATVEPVVVVDAGPGLEAGDDPSVSRDALVTATVTAADVVVAVAAADPVGLARAARALVDLSEVRPGGAAYVVVNRWRTGLGWSRDEVEDLVHRLAPTAGVVLLPEDRAGADRALMAGRAPTECRESALSRGLADLAEDIGGAVADPRRSPRRRRTLLRR